MINDYRNNHNGKFPSVSCLDACKMVLFDASNPYKYDFEPDNSIYGYRKAIISFLSRYNTSVLKLLPNPIRNSCSPIDITSATIYIEVKSP